MQENTKRKFIETVLMEPGYGWADTKGNLVKPGSSTLWKLAFSRMNIFSSKKNWMSFTTIVMLALMSLFFFNYLFSYFSWKLSLIMVFYSLVIMGTHGTIWFHRFCTHNSFQFSHPLWRVITQNLTIRTVPEEVYVVSHHVHHSLSDLPGDPYNARGGFLYCMLAEFNHQRINPDLNAQDYHKVRLFLKSSGVATNSFAQYQKWGSVTKPAYAIAMVIINWSFWYTIFFLIGGHALATALFGAAFLWFIGVRAFNYTGHGKGESKHKEGTDYDRSNLSINQLQPGILTGEWHNNHHLFPGSARAGFLPYQLDLPWIYIYSLHKLGMVKSYRDSKAAFLRRYKANSTINTAAEY
jgi:stearoyl-CoA desaturase (delta-9 desaturase)